MGIIKAGISALRGAAADQWKEAFAAGEMGSDLLMARGVRMTGQRSSNRGGSGVITDGSIIMVGDGECAIVTEGGKITGIYDQPGEQVFRSGKSLGFFGGGVGAFMKDVSNRISFGGDVAISQRLYYINTKELTGGSILADGIPVRLRDGVTGLDMDGRVSCRGSYTFRIADPGLFFNAAIRSTQGRWRNELLSQMDSEVLTALSPALTRLSCEGILLSELPMHTIALCEELRREMSGMWSGLRGIEVFSIGLSSVTVLDAEAIRGLQRDAVFREPAMAAEHIAGAQTDSMRSVVRQGEVTPETASAPKDEPAEQDGWECGCGARNGGKFCEHCGAARPTDWICACGALNRGNYCEYCGCKRP